MRWLLDLIRRRQISRDASDEIDAHIEERIEGLMEEGMSEKEARQQAKREFGNPTALVERSRDQWGWTWVGQLGQDLRYGLRMLAANPGFTVVAAVTTALGIGANTAIFSVVSAVLLAPLPYQEPDRLTTIWVSNLKKGLREFPVSGGDYAEWKASNHVFEAMAASSDDLYTLTGSGNPQTIVSYDFSAEFFRVLGAKPELGRTFLDEEDRPGGPNVTVISDQLWRRTFRADPNLLGKSITLNNTSFTVVGVMPASFQYPPRVELWTPIQLTKANLSNFNAPILRVMARLKRGVSLEQARAEMIAIERRIASQRPDTDGGNGIVLVPLREKLTGDVRRPLLVMLAAVGLVLLIACANVANLLLVRAAARRREVAIRTAVGASRSRLVRQFLTEGALLSGIGGGLGLLLAVWGKGMLLQIFPNNIANVRIPQVTEIPLDARVFAFALLLSLAAGAIFGLAPALQRSGDHAEDALKEGYRGASHGRGVQRFRRVLAAGEIALALILLAGAGLLIESFRNLLDTDFGFRTQHMLTAQMFLLSSKYPFKEPAKREIFVENVIARAKALPGVEAVAAVSFLPLSGFESPSTFTVEGQAKPPAGQEPMADSRLVTPDYFHTMGIRLLRGREFNERDRRGPVQAAIVNQMLARRIWGDQDPLGRRLNFGDDKTPSWSTVVGVVDDVKSKGLLEGVKPEVYQPYAQIPYRIVAFTVRSNEDMSTLGPALEKVIWSVDPDEPIFKMLPLQKLADESLALRRISMVVLATFSGLAVLLAAVGIYGVMAYSVSLRTHEIGLRLALGATRNQVLGLTMREALFIVAPGLAVGLGGALTLTRALSGLLYGVGATDLKTFAAVSFLLAAVALIAGYLPARRATDIDPIAALRVE